MMSDATCAQCGSTREVKLYGGDPDLSPVPLCLLCWARICGLLPE